MRTGHTSSRSSSTALTRTCRAPSLGVVRQSSPPSPLLVAGGAKFRDAGTLVVQSAKSYSKSRTKKTSTTSS